MVRSIAVLVAVASLYGISRSLAPARSGEPQRAEADLAPGGTATLHEPVAEANAGTPDEPSGPLVRERSEVLAPPGEPAHPDDHGHAPASSDRESLAVWLNEHPLSRLPHRVARAYGGRPGAARQVGLHVVVSPDLPTPQLEALVRDLRKRYAETGVVSLHVYDSEEAAVYDRHLDGGALASRHLVARSVRDEGLGVDGLEIRGERLAP